MKKFIVKLILIIGSGIALNVLLIFLMVVYYYVSINRINFSLNPKINTIIVGHSLTECAIDDALLTGVLNWSQSGNHPGITYYKLRKLLSSNENIKYVFYSFGPFINNEENIFKPYGVLQTYPLMSAQEFIDFHFSLSEYKVLLKKLSRKVLSHRIENNVNSFGAYFYLNRNKLEEDIARHNSQRIEINKSPSKYYLSICKLCESRGVKLIFLQTPIYQRQRFFCDVSSVKKQFFSEIEYWDLGNISMPIDCYGDIIHLNRKGALFFTPIFGKMLDNLRDQ